jgi:hypothetical protein
MNQCVLRPPLTQECIIASCLDAGQGRRDLEHLLQTITMTVMGDLAR